MMTGTAIWEPCLLRMDLGSRYRRLLIGIWILTILLVFTGLTAAQGGLTAYALEKFTTHGLGRLMVKRWVVVYHDEYALMVTTLLGASAFIGLCMSVFAAIVLPHWKRWQILTLLITLPAISASLLAAFWYTQAPDLFNWGIRHIALFLGTQVASAVTGNVISSSLLRLIVHLLVPPRMRGWLDDVTPKHG